MRKRRNITSKLAPRAALAVVIGAWLAMLACSGTGPVVTLDADGWDRPPITRERPPNSWENPEAGREVPPYSGDQPGAQGGPSGGEGAAGSGGTCPQCDVTLECVAGTKKESVPLKTANGQCTAPDGVVLDCAGAILLNGKAIGTWSRSGDTYTINVSVQGRSETQVCTTKSGSSTTPMDAGTRG